MTVAWTAHRFSGGVLALDTANTVVLRNYPDRRFDRFDDTIEIGRFAEAASTFRCDEVGRPLVVDDVAGASDRVIRLREAIDTLFRDQAAGVPLKAGRVAELLRACADSLEAGGDFRLTSGAPFGRSDEPLSFEAALAVSALSLLSSGSLAKLKICRHCEWLFLDKSRNSSRLWCDMSVCGNRVKAKQHYRRQKMQREKTDG